MDQSFSAGGRNSDFGAQWYPDIGSQLLLCATILSIQPIAYVLFEIA